MAPTRQQPAYRSVADSLRRRILSGALEPGERLPPEGELAASFGVSRSTAREALRVLASEHLVETTRGVTGGTFVRRPAPEDLAGSIDTGLRFLAGAEELSVDELLEVRELLEVPAARLAARRTDPTGLGRIAATIPDRVGTDLSPTFRAPDEFHARVAEASGNALLAVVATPIFGVLRTEVLEGRVGTAFWRQVDQDHRAILAAIADGDADAASDRMRRHLAGLRRVYEALSESSSDAS